MNNNTTFFVPCLMGLLLTLLVAFCWYLGPNKHAMMLSYGHVDSVTDIKDGRIHHASPCLGQCPKCRKSLRMVHGKYGDFFGCSGYPACKYVKREQASFACPECSGAVEKRVWSGGVLWGCSNYPDCRYAIFSDICDTPCSKCNATLYQIKTVDEHGAAVLTCPNQGCVIG